jgi:hypothetical protein
MSFVFCVMDNRGKSTDRHTDTQSHYLVHSAIADRQTDTHSLYLLHTAIAD